MSYKKDGGKMSMDSPIGMCSYKKNPMKEPRRTSSEIGPGMNADQTKAGKLRKEAHKEKESLRGQSGM